MKIIPLRAVPNQRFTFSNGQDRWVMEIKVAITSMICNLWLNDEPVLLGSRIVAGVPIIWSSRLATDGNFGILTEGGEEPWWEQFGTSQQLVFWESDMAIASTRFVDFRSRNISPSLAELTALVNTAMKIEDIGYYPPTWQALQEAISYALSVVRSHAPEQGQILLATQMLTSAMGDLIEWLGINFATGEWDEALVFSRASTGTYWGPSGTLLEAAVDEARIQHDPVTGEPLGVLIEESRTNNFPFNYDLDSGLDYSGAPGSGNTTRLNISSTDIGIPGVSLTADIDGDVGASNSTTWVSASENYALSVYVKPKTASSVQLGTNRAGLGTAIVRVVLDVPTEEVTVSGLVSGYTGGAKSVGNGWWRLWVSRPSIETADGASHISVYATGLLAGEAIEVAGVNAEIGLIPTSYIPTIDSPVTRAADELSYTLGEEFNPDEGTLRITAQVPEGEVVATIGDLEIVSDDDEMKTYVLSYAETISGDAIEMGKGIFQSLESFPRALTEAELIEVTS